MKDLFLRLYNASCYDEVNSIIYSDNLMSNPHNWLPYGDNINNFGTFENQQATAEAALVEKITNAIDAILVKECIIRGIDPRSDNPEVPKTMNEAISTFFGIKNGSWDNAISTVRREVADKLQLIITGEGRTSTPNIAIYDNGEGQKPLDFKNTFLSLHKGNKLSIPFVQGKFNMGATGAAHFCGGRERYQLIVSRKSKELCENIEDYKFGFTIVREHPLSEEEIFKVRATWYEYFVIDGEIPTFFADSLNLDLNKNKPFIDGTIVKLYSYELTRGCTSNATLDLWRELNTLLYEASLPILICELRDFGGHSNTKVLNGNKTRISIDESEYKYKTLTYSIHDPKRFGGDVPIEITVFKHNVKNSEFIKKRSLIFIQNGQTQGWESTTFISQDLGFRQLRDFMLICVDCTNMRTDIRNDVFMSSRDRMRKCKSYDELKDQIISLLKNDDALKQLNQEYKGKYLHESQDDKNLIQELFQNFKNNKNIQQLLSNNKGLYSSSSTRKQIEQGQSKKTNEKKDKELDLKRFPSIFKVRNLQEKEGKLYKALPLGGTANIYFDTDVENDYLSRSIDRGELEIKIYGYSENSGGSGHHPAVPIDSLTVQRTGPNDGEIRIALSTTETVSVGDMFEISVNLISPDGDMECIVFIGIEKEKEKKKATKQEQQEPELNLPKLIRVFKEKSGDNNITTWEECTPPMKSIDVLQIKSDDVKKGISEILINMDSNLLKRYTSDKSIVTDVANRYVTSIYSHALILYSTLLGYYSSAELPDMEEDTKREVIDDLCKAIENIFTYYGAFLMDFTSLDVIDD